MYTVVKVPVNKLKFYICFILRLKSGRTPPVAKTLKQSDFELAAFRIGLMEALLRLERVSLPMVGNTAKTEGSDKSNDIAIYMTATLVRCKAFYWIVGASRDYGFKRYLMVKTQRALML